MSKDRQRYSVRARNRISQGGSTVASPWACRYRKAHGDATRSEEHTSELQSLLHLVCRLLLEKKKSDPLRGIFDAFTMALDTAASLARTAIGLLFPSGFIIFRMVLKRLLRTRQFTVWSTLPTV